MAEAIRGTKGVVINYREGGGAIKREQGQVRFYPYKKRGGGRKSFRHAELGAQQSFEVVLTQEFEVLAILIGGGAQNVSTL